MQPNVVEHQVFAHKEWKRKILLQLRKKGFRKKFYHSQFFFDQVLKTSPIPCVSLDELVDSPKVILEDFISRNGNLSPEEILVIASLVVQRQPKKILEIGTFDGNTTLQIALNAPPDAKIHTLDLAEGEVFTDQPVLKSDLQFIQDEKKTIRKFKDKQVASKIYEHFGDSTAFDFTLFAKDGSVDFIFIDGGHSYECVKSDTENARKILGADGAILWHDFTPMFGGVYRFLCELSQELPLTHIMGTNLVMYRRGDET